MKALATLVLALFASLAQAQNTAILAWDAPTSYMDGAPIPTGTVITYTAYQGLKGQTLVSIGTVTTSGRTISTGLQSGQEYCWEVTSRVSTGPESARSNQACKAFPPSPPNRVTLTVN